jgi:hypothetical protein
VSTLISLINVEVGIIVEGGRLKRIFINVEARINVEVGRYLRNQ